ncbi:hypothetical protein QWY85_14075 [Neolewinella lacunae]|uniref:Uncharacterized protein n=1 Tax=Neolewinella lacunae TaxID=1517758 RepID=A0A923PKR1_9BACT|nr:hypothetical protein [Neolewinella lacunae]MBC6993003.1 hypothetical protein [Neolewinella lacunae]MDN3635793.1 hypothetical protein [Neolewinella lacunae]
MKYFYLCIALALTVSSCTPLRVVRLEPEETPSAYSYGDKILQRYAGDVGVAVSYYDATPQFLVFNLTVENTGDEAFDFSPEGCLLVPDVGPVSRAINPEEQLLSMDIDNMERLRNGRAWAWIGAAVVVAGTVAAVTVDAPALDNGVASVGSSFAQDLAINTASALAFGIAEGTDVRDYRMHYLPAAGEIPVPENRYFWLDHSLRITTIEPGQKAFGKIVFPRNDEASKFLLRVEAKGEEFEFPFSQRVFR